MKYRPISYGQYIEPNDQAKWGVYLVNLHDEDDSREYKKLWIAVGLTQAEAYARAGSVADMPPEHIIPTPDIKP